MFGYQLPLGIFYLFFVLFWVVGFSNAVNLTDGIDGLASISVVISLLTYGVIAYVQGQFDVLLLIGTMIGALLGFFLFNHKPAKVFMGMWGVWPWELCWQLFPLPCVKNGPYSLSELSTFLKQVL